MFKNKFNYHLINWLALLALLYIAFSNINLWLGILGKVIQVMAPFIIAFAFAYALTPFVELLQRKGLSQKLAVTITILGTVIIIVGLLVITLPLLYDQLTLLVGMVGDITDNIDSKFHINLGDFELKITDALNSTLKDLSTVISNTTLDFINKSLSFISKFIVGFVGFIYFLADMDKIRKWIKNVTLSFSKRFYNYVKCMDHELGNYLKGLGIFMIIQFFEYSFLFFIVGHPNWLILGILACLTTVIPYFGGIITNVIAIIMASVVSVPLVIATIVICLIFPQIDGYVISPRVYGKTTGVSPLITIMAVSVGGTLAGMWGIVLALPTYLLIRTTYKFYEDEISEGVDKIKEKVS